MAETKEKGSKAIKINKKAKGKFGDDYISNSIAVKYGDAIKRGTEVLQNISNKEILSFSPIVDMALGGGIREGTIVGLAGPPKCGKTTSVLHFASKCQKINRKVIYLNVEGRMNSQNFNGIKDLSIEDLLIVESTDEHTLSGEQFLEIAETYIRTEPGCILIIDSLSNLIPQNELDGELNAQTRNSLPRLLAQFFKRSGNYITKNNIIMICVAHQIADTGPSRRTKMTDCGNMFQYQVSTNLEITHKSTWKNGSAADSEIIGQTMNWKVLTSNTGGIPDTQHIGYLRYGIGVDEVQEVIETACEFCMIHTAGSWFTISCLVDDLENEHVAKYLKDNEIEPDKVESAFKFQGKSKLSAFLTENPELTSLINDKTREFLSCVE